MSRKLLTGVIMTGEDILESEVVNTQFFFVGFGEKVFVNKEVNLFCCDFDEEKTSLVVS